MKNKYITLIVFLIVSTTLHAQSIVVNDPADPQTNLSAEDLIKEVLVSGSSCLDIELTNLAENPSGVGNLSERSWGYFKKGNTNFPFEEGIILSSGFAVNAEGPNDTTASSDTGSNWTGDIDLKTILDNQYGTPQSTNNATVFEFTFTSSLSEIDFEFIFASEEYENQFECSDTFRDGFVFLVKGPGIPNDSGAPFGGTNIASVPGSDDVPVNTASIHLGSGSILPCPGQVLGVDYFPDLYVTNSTPPTNEIQFDGLTISLTTATIDIVPNELYTIKMVIADRGDSSFDSAVFLKAGSFNLGVDLGADITLDDPAAQCTGDPIILDAGENPGASYQWFKDGILIPGATNQTLEITETGLYRVELTFPQTACIVFDEILVEFFPLPDFDLGPDQLICEEEIIILDATVTNPGELNDLAYKWFKDGVEIPGETNPTLAVAETGLYAAEVTGNGCIVTDEAFIEIVSFTVDIGDFIEPCGESGYEIVPVIVGADPSGATYLWSTGETTPTITVTEDGDYSVEVTIDGCTETDDVTINFRTLPEIELGETVIKCAQDVIVLTAAPVNGNAGDFTYTWYQDGGILAGETSSTLEVTEEGIYSVEVNDDGCIAEDSLAVTFYENENCVISQGISPNNDGQNDFFDLEFLNDKFKIEKLSIYNLHGRTVYEREQYVNEWDGTSDDGNELPVGTYYYVITLQNDDPITGWIYLNK